MTTNQPVLVWKCYKFKGFTLAEVLITLGIIGVIAALTIPTLINKYQKQHTAVAIEQTISILTQAFKMAENDYGSMDQWDNPVTQDTAGYKDWWTKYSIIPYLSVAKQCSTLTGCWADSSTYWDQTTSLSSYIGTSYPCVILNNGTTLCFTTVSYNSMTKQNYARIWLDINGQKTPNILGKDIFRIEAYYNIGKVMGSGAIYGRAYLVTTGDGCCNKNATGHPGAYCAGLIQLDNWQITNEYPWD